MNTHSISSSQSTLATRKSSCTVSHCNWGTGTYRLASFIRAPYGGIVCRRRGLVLPSPGFPDGVLGAAYSVLNLASSLLRRPFGLGLSVAGHLADSLFNSAFYLMRNARDAIFIHNRSLGCSCFTYSPREIRGDETAKISFSDAYRS
jgi:hypothetical protein